MRGQIVKDRIWYEDIRDKVKVALWWTRKDTRTEMV